MASRKRVEQPVVDGAGLLPDLIGRALAAHNRLTYCLTLLQTATAYAQAPHKSPPTLRLEREASGLTDATLDNVVTASRMVSDAIVRIPGAASILAMVFASIRQMLEPLATAASWRSDLRERAELYQRRLDQLIAQAPPCADDQLPPTAVGALTRRVGNGHDTLHQLAMDLHAELNRLQADTSHESLEGARAFGLTPADRVLVRAFISGINASEPVRLAYPGVGTTATRDGDRLSIQNDLGADDLHPIVVQVTSYTATVIYTDQHRSRIRFFCDLMQQHDIGWEIAAAHAGAEHETAVGRFTAATDEQLESFLRRLGSRIVYLIDWNHARKSLSRFVKSSDVVAILKWAADSDVGHRAFLLAGEAQLIHTALERAAPDHLRYGGRLDDLLGRESARSFLMSVLRITYDGMNRGSSARAIDDAIEAELLPHLQHSDRTMLGAAVEHATVIAASVEWIGHAVTRLKDAAARTEAATAAAIIRTWRSQADEVVRRAIRVLDHSGDPQPFRRLMANGEQAVRSLERSAFALTLMPPESDATAVALLDSLSSLVSSGVREYVRCLEEARDLTRAPERADLDRFLVTVDRLVALEHHCDAAERAVLERLIRGPGDFRELHLFSTVAGHLDSAFDSLVQSGLIVRDYVLAVASGP
jgi:hypothetical protein